jgi:AAA domain
MKGGANPSDQMAEARAAATAAIVDSAAAKKLVVAGPGTGKTHTFEQALQTVDGKGLALTFIRNLVADLEEALGDLADVFTFHGYCKRQMHLASIEGLVGPLDYYPPFLELVAHDLRLLGRPDVMKDDIERALHNLDDSNSLTTYALRLGEYFTAVSHTDVVFRMLRFFEARDDRVQVYPLIVVDEYQDFSRLETSFIAQLATRSPVLIAGDDDQALYDFKNASARYIRELHAGGAYEKFELPFCSRCTEVVVAAVNDSIAAATANGNLIDRITKQFRCYLPDKQADSAAHPRIIHARCTVERNNAPYIGRYITKQISQIPLEDIRESHDKGYPTVLVIGPNPFLRRAYDVINQTYPQAVLKVSRQPSIELLDGYRRLAEDDRSRLGWRIVIHCDPFENADDNLVAVLRDESELADALPDEYRDRHLRSQRSSAYSSKESSSSTTNRRGFAPPSGSRSRRFVRRYRSPRKTEKSRRSRRRTKASRRSGRLRRWKVPLRVPRASSAPASSARRASPATTSTSSAATTHTSRATRTRSRTRRSAASWSR